MTPFISRSNKSTSSRLLPTMPTVRPSPPSSQKPRRRWLWITLGMSAIAIISATAGAILAASLASTPLLQSHLSPDDADAFEQDGMTDVDFQMPKLTRPVNILVMGVKVLTSDLDSPPPELEDLGYHALVNSFEGLSDTMLLIRFDPDNDDLTVLSLPRDTQVTVDGLGTVKLNVTNYYGGPAMTARTVNDLLDGVGIDRYVRLNVQGVEDLVDALGGVDVYVPYDMEYRDDSQHLYIDLEEGQQQLNGDEALQFLRFRYDDYGDIGRIQRQQLLMRAMVEQTLTPRTVARLPRILSVIQDHVDTNLSVEELVALVGFAAGIDRENVQMLMLPGEFGSQGSEYSYWLPDYNRIEDMVNQHFIGIRPYPFELYDPGVLRVAIQDSTGRSRSVDNLLDVLYEEGYGNVYIDRPWSEPLEQTYIIAQQGDIEAAEAVQAALGLGEIRVESTGELQSDITIRIGEDWLSAY